ncbi:hypothetical protein FB451DRAFT_985679, partial [Mycena latifolia]
PPTSPVKSTLTEMAPRPLQQGMEHGFERSPMAELRKEYTDEGETQSSIYVRATLLVGKKFLEKADLMDRGAYIDPSQSVARFGLEKGFSLRTRLLVSELQSLLTRASELVAGHTSCFLVDPHQVLMTALGSAQDLQEMTVAWTLSRRIELAQLNFLKYEAEYMASDEDGLLLSPVSTEPEIYSVF